MNTFSIVPQRREKKEATIKGWKAGHNFADIRISMLEKICW